jgi:RHS repeat-associated protein
VNESPVPAPDREDFVEYIRYEYSPEGDLIEAFDALGHPMRMGYDRHLLIKETKSSGLSIHFTYEGRGSDDRCAATRGPDSPNGEASAQAVLPPWEARFTRDQLGLEIERTLPGGVRARWERDLLGRPLKHEIWSGTAIVSTKAYSWEPCRVGSSPALPVTNHRGRVWEPSQGSHFKVRLKLIVDALNGPVQYRHDGLGNLTAAIYADGKVDLRMPDAVGNLFKTNDKKDRKYGPAGQLLESNSPQGTTKYEYDPEGNLAKKLLPDGSEWHYEWNVAGMLAKVLRPDGKTVEFGYDPLGRRTWKKYGAKTTKWIWDGNVPVHEWVEVDPQGLEDPPAQHEAADWESGLTARKFALCKRTAQGPPPPEAAGTASAPITWVFEPESFAPIAKLTATARYGIVTDHLGTPTAMLDERGKTAWSADIGVYGDLQNVVGERGACPFRWPGQYEDEETGLYYNRFRYYDPEEGGYVSQDPIRLRAGLHFVSYANDPLTLTDPLGLSCVPTDPEVADAIASGRPIVVVGRRMSRVDPVRDALRAAGANVKTYEPRNFRSKTSLNPKDVEANREWIRHWAKKKGALVVDIGNDPDPTTTPSAFYEVEKRSLGRWAADVDVVKYNPGF